MKARIEKLRKQVSQLIINENETFYYYYSQKATKLAIYGTIDHILDQRLLFPELEKISELKCQEDCDAIAFFVAFIQRHYSPHDTPLSLASGLSEFLEKLKTNPRYVGPARMACYREMVYWGKNLQKSYEVAIDSRKTPIVTPSAQVVLKEVVSPQFFINPANYRKMLLEEKAYRYQEYREARRRDRDLLPGLHSQLRIHQLHRSLGTIFALIPGGFLLTNGLSDTWRSLRQGSPVTALFVFISYALISALSPLAALVNYWAHDYIIENIEHHITEAEPSKDYVVTRVLSESEYTSHREFRKRFKGEHLPDTSSSNITNALKPKKHIVKFTEAGENKVRLYLDKQQAERFDAYQSFRFGRRSDPNMFFQSLKSSKEESAVTAELLNIDHEKRAPQRQ